MKTQQEVGVSVGEVLESVLKERFGEPPQMVEDKVVRHTGGHFVRVSYDKTRDGFRLKGEILLLEKLNLELEVPAREGRGRRVDAVISRAAVARPRYSSGSRVFGSTTVSENTSLVFVGMTQYSFYRPKGLLFEKVSGKDAQLSARGMGWESFFRRADVELSRRIKDWKQTRSTKVRKGSRKRRSA